MHLCLFLGSPHIHCLIWLTREDLQPAGAVPLKNFRFYDLNKMELEPQPKYCKQQQEEIRKEWDKEFSPV